MSLEPWQAQLILGLGLALAVAIVLGALVWDDVKALLRRRKRKEDDESDPH